MLAGAREGPGRWGEASIFRGAYTSFALQCELTCAHAPALTCACQTDSV